MTTSAADRLSAAREHARALDRKDPLAPLAHEFLQPQHTIYLDGNSLGMLPKGALPLMRRTLEDEWGQGLIRSWVDTDWYRKVSVLGDRIGKLIGAAGGQTIVVDTTSLNLFKVLVAALRLAPGRRRIVSEASNFPTDLYMVHGVRELFPGTELVLAGRDGTLDELVDTDTACVLLTQVDFRTGARHDMAEVT
ncbi:MAG: kynureninase, partial [Burkholderiales bacterium]